MIKKNKKVQVLGFECILNAQLKKKYDLDFKKIKMIFLKKNIEMIAYHEGVWECGNGCFLKCFSLRNISK
jgi:hypothetical protein